MIHANNWIHPYKDQLRSLLKVEFVNIITPLQQLFKQKHVRNIYNVWKETVKICDTEGISYTCIEQSEIFYTLLTSNETKKLWKKRVGPNDIDLFNELKIELDLYIDRLAEALDYIS